MLLDDPSTSTSAPVSPQEEEASTSPQTTVSAEPIIDIERVDFHYGTSKALSEVTLSIPKKQVTAFIGPSGCGKSTLLRCLNRMNDLIEGARISEGQIRILGTDIYGADVDPIELRKRVGMVFQKSNPFPKSIYDNVAYGMRIAGVNDKTTLDEVVEGSLKKAALWEETKDRLQDNAVGLSGGQQQRLCIARAIAVQPEIILMDEPCSALDPIATIRIEELIAELKQDYTIVIVTHNMQQASRVSDRTALFYLGELVEEGETETIFHHPDKKQTEDYISGRFG